MTVLVFWNYQAFRQSKRLVDLVLKNIADHHAWATTKILFVNTDLLYKMFEE